MRRWIGSTRSSETTFGVLRSEWMEIEFLTLRDVLDVHADQVRRYGGATSIRDQGLLESAIAQPSAAFGGSFLRADTFEMAAA